MTIESALGDGTLVAVCLPLDCRRAKARSNGTVRINAVSRRPAFKTAKIA
jgi:hypothetical protein